jgi:hypothetical protein
VERIKPGSLDIKGRIAMVAAEGLQRLLVWRESRGGADQGLAKSGEEGIKID